MSQLFRRRRHMTTVYNSPGDPKYLLTDLRWTREQMQTGLVIAKLPDEYFERPLDGELVEMTVLRIGAGN